MINLGGCGEFAYALEASLGEGIGFDRSGCGVEAKELVDVELRLLCRRDLDRCGG